MHNMPALTQEERAPIIAWNLLEKDRLEMMGDVKSSRYISVCITLAALTAPVAADVVAWNHPNEERTCSVNLREFRLKPGPLYTAPLVPELRLLDGWKVVPVEPTAEMVKAGKGGVVTSDMAREVYDDMLAAAPEAPQ